MSKHRGRFKWKKYSKYRGNLRRFWTAKDRPDQTRHRKEECLQEKSNGVAQHLQTVHYDGSSATLCTCEY